MNSWQGSKLTEKSRRVYCLFCLFSWTVGSCKIFGVWFDPVLLMENWSEVLENVVATTDLWRLSLRAGAKCAGHTSTSFIVLQYFLFRVPSYSIWKGLFSCLSWAMRQFRPTEWVPNVETCRHTLCLSFLGRMCVKQDEMDDFWKKDTRKVGEKRTLEWCPETRDPSIVNIGMLW